MYFNLRMQVRYFDLSMIFRILPTKLVFYLLTTFGFVLYFLAAKTLVTLSNKEKESSSTEAGPSTSRMGVDSTFLEPGTRPC
jgi:hypothetical protein